MVVPTLQLQCLYAVAGRLEEYSSQTLSLLPTSLRYQLLLRLPIVDICPLERDETFMTGIDSNEVWFQIKNKKELFKCGISFGYKTIKDEVLGHIACRFFNKFNSQLLAHYLYEVLISEDMHVVSLASFREQNPAAKRRWAVPQRYASEAESACLPDMWKRFFHYCQWLPTVLELNACHLPSVTQYNYLQQLLPHVEEVHVGLTVAQKELDPVTPAFLSVLFHAVLNAAKVNSISLETTYSDYLRWLIVQLLIALKVDNSDGLRFYDCIKRLKIVCEGCTLEDPPPVEDLVQLISLQKGMEVFTVHHLDIQEESWHTESLQCGAISLGLLYNYLPHFVSKPCFQLLHVESSKIPCNSMESMITAFLNNPTYHDQCLEFCSCEVLKKSLKTLSLSECELQQSEEFGLYEVAERWCIAGEHKSLSVPVGEPLFPLQWLADYPGLRLKRLDLQLIVPKDMESQAARFSATSEALNLFGRSVDVLGVTFILGRCQEFHPNICEVLNCQSLFELRFGGCFFNDNFLVMSSYIHNAKSLKLIGFNLIGFIDGVSWRTFFNAVFSMPREQLANLTLEFSGAPIRPQDIFRAWRESAGGQKIRIIKCSHHNIHQIGFLQDMAIEHYVNA